MWSGKPTYWEFTSVTSNLANSDVLVADNDGNLYRVDTTTTGRSQRIPFPGAPNELVW